MKKQHLVILLSASVVILFAINLLVGSVAIPADEVFRVLLGGEATKESWQFILLESRLPQTVTATLCGSALSACGLMLQTAFRNPLAGSSILGINSGASLGVALVMLLLGGSVTAGAFSLSGFLSVLMGAFVGAMAVLAAILFLSTLIRDNVLLLIAGIMIGYVASSVISLLNYFATAEGVQSYLVWGLGNFGGVSRSQLPAFTVVVLAGLAGSVLLVKPLNALMLGDRYAENLGVNTRRVRTLLLMVTGLLTAVVTAFCGPIAFIDLAVPHVARLMLGTANHKWLLPVTILAGAAVALLCNVLCLIPGKGGILPLNAVTPLIGAPVIVYVLLKGRAR